MKTKSLQTTLVVLYLLQFLNLTGQTYKHPTTGIAGENVGSCEVATCSGTYTDNGGTSGDYSNNINGTYRVFCPSTAGMCTRITFNSFNTEDQFDFLRIGNGPTQNSTALTTLVSGGTTYNLPYVTSILDYALTGNLNGYTPFYLTSTDASGCLSVRFWSDWITRYAGWSATISCVPCSYGPTGTANSDCSKATGICSNSSITSNSTGPGIVAEGCTGTACPAGGENFTNWYRFQPSTSGTLNITITPNNSSADYDFAIFGPNASCSSLGTPLRCSDAGTTGTTGTSASALDYSESVSGDGYVASMNVTAGQSFYLMVDSWSPPSGGYTLSFSGSASLDCIVLPVELTTFNATYSSEDDVVDIYWKTETERNNDYFTLEKSYDGFNFTAMGKIDGAGNSDTPTEYYVIDPETTTGVTYYRLKQTDFDGQFKYSEITSVNILPEDKNEVYVYPNPTAGNMEIYYYTSSETAEIIISNPEGKIIHQQTKNSVIGGNSLSLNLAEEASGIYFITVKTGNKILTNRFVKL